MLSENSLAELTAQIMEQGFDREISGLYASLIGDLPLSDGQGNVIVRDERGRELARLARLAPLKMFSRP